jgi:HAE1 family hydrophobic/amphiphilic exporter-1
VTNVGQVLGGFGSIPQQGSQYAQINVRLKEKSGLFERLLHGANGATRSRSDSQITQQLRAPLTDIGRSLGARVTASAVRSVAGISLPIEIQLRGSDTNRLAQFAAQVRDLLLKVPGVLDPDVSVRSGKPEIRVQIDPARAAQFHIPVNLAGATLRDAVSGNTDAIFHEGSRDLLIRTRLAGVSRDDPRAVGDIAVGYDAQGQPVALADIADIAVRPAPTSIERNNGQRLVTVTADLAPNHPLGNVQQEVQRQLDALPHEGIDIHWGGEAETLDENVIPFATALILAVVLVYLVMASLFNNLTTPLVIMFTLPMALVGALGALVLTGESLSLIAAIGIIMLVGLMGRNAILLLDYTNTLRGRGLTRSEAIEQAGATRLRPILMTTTATIVGMLPVALRIGRASEIRAPMALVVIGGLLVSSALTLLMIPVLYSLFDDLFGKKNPPEGA